MSLYTKRKTDGLLKNQMAAVTTGAAVGIAGIAAEFLVNWARGMEISWMWGSSDDIKAVILLASMFMYVSRSITHYSGIRKNG